MKVKKTIAYTMGDLIQRTSLEDMDERTRHRGKMCIMDMLGVILAAWPEESTQILYRVIKRHGGLKESSVLGAGDFLPAAHAALINSAMAHSLELEDHHSHTRSLNHPGVCTIAPALAISERENNSGRDFLTAVILGYEIGSRISAATRLGVMNLERGFHESSICGPFSAATATGKLMAANPDVLANAMGICGSTAAGSMEFKSNEAWSKRFQVGNAARNGILALELAREGFTGPTTIFEGRHNFFHSYVHEGNYELSGILRDWGASWDINFIQYKPFACAGVLHSAVTAARQLHIRDDFDPRQVKRIVIKTATKIIEEYAMPAKEKKAPHSPVGAQFSLQYSVAVMLKKGRALVEEFQEKSIHDPDVLRLAALVEVEADPTIDKGWPAQDPTEIMITLKNGRMLTASVSEAKGDLNNPVTDAELFNKFRNLVLPFFGRDNTERAIEMIMQIERLADIKALSTLFRQAPQT